MNKTRTKTIKLKTALIEAVSRKAGMTAEEYIAVSRSILCGRKVCAHFSSKTGAYSVFVCR